MYQYYKRMFEAEAIRFANVPHNLHEMYGLKRIGFWGVGIRGWLFMLVTLWWATDQTMANLHTASSPQFKQSKDFMTYLSSSY
jgi:hypothetical protein